MKIVLITLIVNLLLSCVLPALCRHYQNLFFSPTNPSSFLYYLHIVLLTIERSKKEFAINILPVKRYFDQQHQWKLTTETRTNPTVANSNTNPNNV